MRRRRTSSEHELLDETVAELHRTGSFSLVFGGLAGSRGVHICSLRGHRTPLLAGLHVEQHRGLGGRSLIEQRPRIAGDYRSCRAITHDYDRQVLGEGVRSLFAVPVLVGGVVRGIIYGAQREISFPGGIAVQPVVRAAAGLQLALASRDEAERMRLGLRGEADPAEVPAVSAQQLESVRTSFAQLRSIASRVDDPQIAQQLRLVERRLSAALSRRPEDRDEAEEPVCLSPRELDVLGHAALGLRNAEIGRELGLREATIKSYLASAMRKLNRRSRHGAVAEARRRGILP